VLIINLHRSHVLCNFYQLLMIGYRSLHASEFARLFYSEAMKIAVSETNSSTRKQ